MIERTFEWKTPPVYDLVMQVCMDDGGDARLHHIRREDNPFSNFDQEMAGAWEVGWVAADTAIGGKDVGIDSSSGGVS